MDETPQIPELFILLYGDRAALAFQNAGPRLLLWAGAFDAWLESLPTNGRSPLRRIARKSWADFLAFHQASPWEVRREDVDAWRAEMGKNGLSPVTIRMKVRSLRDFYDHCLLTGLDPQLPPGFNPACVALGPEPPRYQQLVYLDSAEARALLAAVDRDSSLVGKRDYALILLALRTGLEIGQIRHIRWGDLLLQGDAIRLEWSGFGAKRLPLRLSALLPTNVWAAIQDYLQASGRRPVLQPDHHLFAPLSDPLAPPPVGQPAEWEPSRPLSADNASHLLSQYARWAGLDEKLVTWHALRHTAAVLRLQAGDNLEDVRCFLGKTSRESMQAFMRQLLSQPKTPLWRSPAEPPAGSTSRRSKGSPPGAQNRLVHGFYAGQHQPAQSGPTSPQPEEAAAPPLPPPIRLQKNLRQLQTILDRTMERAGQTESVEEMLHLADIYSKVAARMASLQKSLGPTPDTKAYFQEYFDRAVSQAAHEIALDIKNGVFPAPIPGQEMFDDDYLEAYFKLVRCLLDMSEDDEED